MASLQVLDSVHYARSPLGQLRVTVIGSKLVQSLIFISDYLLLPLKILLKLCLF